MGGGGSFLILHYLCFWGRRAAHTPFHQLTMRSYARHGGRKTTGPHLTVHTPEGEGDRRTAHRLASWCSQRCPARSENICAPCNSAGSFSWRPPVAQLPKNICSEGWAQDAAFYPGSNRLVLPEENLPRKSLSSRAVDLSTQPGSAIQRL